ncbi:CerR family C-terminal domain-containing protein [Sphingobium boeckii]|uniref:AcrR family transcriptional regulator n=1 Tax=Sphingobium boeckii TaxID=1082345 RepID=A0A7W9AFU3_9SPHN|nr:CerR family C-terminal domain-containing protein [Sphingobium boeckii]MBB5684840.1 AcrR family transcriptional regulator [Sphingobium boeckii]
MKYRPAEGGYVRGDETRQLIIDMAIPIFGDRGFEGASTRMLVAAAGASPAAIQYYFGGKAGLYRACAECLADNTWQKLNSDARHLDDLPPGTDPDVMIDALADFFLAQEKTLHDDRDMAQRALFLAREQMSSSGPVFDIIFERLNQRVLMKFAPVVGAVIGKASDDPETRLRTAMIIAHMVGMRSHGQITLRFLGWSNFDDNLLLWGAVMRTHLRAMLSAELAI